MNEDIDNILSIYTQSDSANKHEVDLEYIERNIEEVSELEDMNSF